MRAESEWYRNEETLKSGTSYGYFVNEVFIV